MGMTLRRTVLTTVAACGLIAPLAAGSAQADVPQASAPIGGGYETPSLEGFGRLAAEGASGPTVDPVVGPRA